MRYAAESAKIEIPFVIFFVESHFFDSLQQYVISLFTLASADKFARACHQQIGSGDGFAVIIQAHIECFDILRVIGDEDRFFKYFALLDDVQLRKLDEDGFDVISVNGKTFRYAMGFERFVDELAKSFPDERNNILQYVEKLKLIASHSPLYNLQEISNHVFLNIESVKSSVNEFINSITDNPILRNVLAGNLPLYAGVKDVTPLYIHALINKFYIQSAYRIVGGSAVIAKSLEKSVISFGGETPGGKKKGRTLSKRGESPI